MNSLFLHILEVRPSFSKLSNLQDLPMKIYALDLIYPQHSLLGRERIYHNTTKILELN